MSIPVIRRWDRETALVAWLAACVSLGAFLFYFQRGQILLYGDAVAHINIARRVFDSRTPGLLQLGTVWLPLPHLLMIPFLLSDWMWRTGVGGSIPSMVAYVLSVLGIYRLARGALSFCEGASRRARVAAWAAAIVYAANPNLLYLQATAMTELPYLALFIWAIVYFSEFVAKMTEAKAVSSLAKCGLCVMAACLTRYDGWFLAAALCAALIVLMIARYRIDVDKTALRRFVGRFVLAAVAAPVLWLAYNAVIYRNPLEFANGPYSAKAIEKKTSAPGAPPHPGTGSVGVAALYFLKAAELNVANQSWLQRLWLLMAIAGVARSLNLGRSQNARRTSTQLMRSRERLSWLPWPLLMLWSPLPFYALSVAYGGVPIFVSAWWPFSRYNVRYGLELLPAFAVFAAIAVNFTVRLARHGRTRLAIATATMILVGLSYGSIWRDPVSFREAWINSRTRMAVEAELARYLKALPSDATLLMYLGDHAGALQEAGIPLRRVINEGNHRPWKLPSDPDGLWERALANPEKYADYVIAFERDSVWVAVRKEGLASLAVIRVSGQPEATIYLTHPLSR